MDFHGMKRKDLQALCKKHKIPANTTNLQMADRLSSLLKENRQSRVDLVSCLKGSGETAGTIGSSGLNISEDKRKASKKVTFCLPEKQMKNDILQTETKVNGFPYKLRHREVLSVQNSVVGKKRPRGTNKSENNEVLNIKTSKNSSSVEKTIENRTTRSRSSRNREAMVISENGLLQWDVNCSNISMQIEAGLMRNQPMRRSRKRKIGNLEHRDMVIDLNNGEIETVGEKLISDEFSKTKLENYRTIMKRSNLKSKDAISLPTTTSQAIIGLELPREQENAVFQMQGPIRRSTRNKLKQNLKNLIGESLIDEEKTKPNEIRKRLNRVNGGEIVVSAKVKLQEEDQPVSQLEGHLRRSRRHGNRSENNIIPMNSQKKSRNRNSKGTTKSEFAESASKLYLSSDMGLSEKGEMVSQESVLQIQQKEQNKIEGKPETRPFSRNSRNKRREREAQNLEEKLDVPSVTSKLIISEDVFEEADQGINLSEGCKENHILDVKKHLSDNFSPNDPNKSTPDFSIDEEKFHVKANTNLAIPESSFSEADNVLITVNDSLDFMTKESKKIKIEDGSVLGYGSNLIIEESSKLENDKNNKPSERPGISSQEEVGICVRRDEATTLFISNRMDTEKESYDVGGYEATTLSISDQMDVQKENYDEVVGFKESILEQCVSPELFSQSTEIRTTQESFSQQSHEFADKPSVNILSEVGETSLVSVKSPSNHLGPALDLQFNFGDGNLIHGEMGEASPGHPDSIQYATLQHILSSNCEGRVQDVVEFDESMQSCTIRHVSEYDQHDDKIVKCFIDPCVFEERENIPDIVISSECEVGEEEMSSQIDLWKHAEVPQGISSQCDKNHTDYMNFTTFYATNEDELESERDIRSVEIKSEAIMTKSPCRLKGSNDLEISPETQEIVSDFGFLFHTQELRGSSLTNKLNSQSSRIKQVIDLEHDGTVHRLSFEGDDVKNEKTLCIETCMYDLKECSPQNVDQERREKSLDNEMSEEVLNASGSTESTSETKICKIQEEKLDMEVGQKKKIIWNDGLICMVDEGEKTCIQVQANRNDENNGTQEKYRHGCGEDTKNEDGVIEEVHTNNSVENSNWGYEEGKENNSLSDYKEQENWTFKSFNFRDEENAGKEFLEGKLCCTKVEVLAQKDDQPWNFFNPHSLTSIQETLSRDKCEDSLLSRPDDDNNKKESDILHVSISGGKATIYGASKHHKLAGCETPSNEDDCSYEDINNSSDKEASQREENGSTMATKLMDFEAFKSNMRQNIDESWQLETLEGSDSRKALGCAKELIKSEENAHNMEIIHDDTRYPYKMGSPETICFEDQDLLETWKASLIEIILMNQAEELFNKTDELNDIRIEQIEACENPEEKSSDEQNHSCERVNCKTNEENNPKHENQDTLLLHNLKDLNVFVENALMPLQEKIIDEESGRFFEVELDIGSIPCYSQDYSEINARSNDFSLKDDRVTELEIIDRRQEVIEEFMPNLLLGSSMAQKLILQREVSDDSNEAMENQNHLQAQSAMDSRNSPGESVEKVATNPLEIEEIKYLDESKPNTEENECRSVFVEEEINMEEVIINSMSSKEKEIKSTEVIEKDEIQPSSAIEVSEVTQNKDETVMSSYCYEDQIEEINSLLQKMNITTVKKVKERSKNWHTPHKTVGNLNYELKVDEMKENTSVLTSKLTIYSTQKSATTTQERRKPLGILQHFTTNFRKI